MGGGDAHDAAGLTHTRKPVAGLEMMHEGIDALARGRQVPADRDIVLGA
jgi:hypothetical protein